MKKKWLKQAFKGCVCECVSVSPRLGAEKGSDLHPVVQLMFVELIAFSLPSREQGKKGVR